ncbi:MAG: hypothetical protein KJ970_08245 [Candidatus Eisenbacteria bacterium]|uniref:DUF5668 domain-containing protein n=1 Tax=Eiseniibacteriota bacterium TaxID=2212470 RepID=A0A948RZ51_UNCEI|nr:hypothetical protein [Candidatus Eisenbacteria bacterium]MBU1950987.1 hypothetical protein [Candidatus Eisenbacteria bacterium]MBU2690904.1 hypothetical protein [Candidatus Eisenbacteria bacterium]
MSSYQDGTPDPNFSPPGQARQAPPLPQGAPAPVHLPPARRKSAALAGFLSMLPGLGQVYVGYYQRGFINIIVVSATITLLANDVGALSPLLGIFLSFYWLYNVVDAVRLASFYNEALAGMGPDPLRDQKIKAGAGGSMVGGALLLLVGFILFLNSVFEISLDWLEDWWPVLPMALGVYLLYQGIKERQKLDSKN